MFVSPGVVYGDTKLEFVYPIFVILGIPIEPGLLCTLIGPFILNYFNSPLVFLTIGGGKLSFWFSGREVIFGIVSRMLAKLDWGFPYVWDITWRTPITSLWIFYGAEGKKKFYLDKIFGSWGDIQFHNYSDETLFDCSNSHRLHITPLRISEYALLILN